MTIQPVGNAPAPGYPDKSRWLAAPLAVGLSAAMALGFSGCGGERVTMGEPALSPTETTACIALAETETSTTQATMTTTGTSRRAQSTARTVSETDETTTYVNMGTTALVPATEDYFIAGMPALVPDRMEALP